LNEEPFSEARTRRLGSEAGGSDRGGSGTGAAFDPVLVAGILERAAELPPEERAAFVERTVEREAGGDPALVRRIERILAEEGPEVPYFDELERCVRGDLELEVARAPAEQLGPYRLLRELGEGGMGTVYLAERADGQFEQTVAIKVLRRGMTTDSMVQRFLAERQILAGLEHPGIARLLDGGIDDRGRPYIVMERVEGLPLLAHCDRARLPLRERIALFESVCEAVDYAHGRLVVHRDLKPSNILVTGSGQVKLVDFGIAKLLSEDSASSEMGATPTRDGLQPMTPEYAAPEQVRGEPVTTASDVYALGVVLYELLVGSRPYRVERAGAGALESAVLEQQPTRPSTRLRQLAAEVGSDRLAELAASRGVGVERWRRQLAGDLETICLTALQKDPARRYPSAARLREDLARYRSGLPITARPDTFAYRARKLAGRHPWAVSATLGVLALLLVGVVVLLAQNRRIRQERDKAEQVTELLVSVFEVSDPSEARGAEISARELLDRGAAQVSDGLAGQPLVRAELLDVLGRVYRSLGLYQRASEQLEAALGVRRSLLGDAHPEVVETLLRMGDLERVRGDYQRAESLLREALERARGRFGADSLEVVRASDALGKTLLARGDRVGARELFEAALGILQRRREARSVLTAEVENNLASLELGEGDFAAAEARFRRSLALRRELLGGDHPAVAAILNNLAALLSQRGDHAAAQATWEQALELYLGLHGEEHPLSATALNNLGLARLAQGDVAGAEQDLRRGLELRRRLLSADHPDLAASLSNLGFVVQGRGDTEQAGALHREALAIRRAALGDQDPRVAQSLNNVGLLALEDGRLDEAERAFREAEGILGASLGSRHPLTATTRSNLGVTLLRRGDPRDALAELEAAHAVRTATLPAGHSDLAYSLVGIAECQIALGRGERAEESARQAIEIRRARLPPGHWLIAEASTALAGALLASGESEAARELLAEAVGALEQARGASRWTVEQARRRWREAGGPLGGETTKGRT
jgi:serine/threonine-protein kinase